MKMLRRLWADEAGFVVSSELVLVGTMLVIGMIVGLTSLRNQVVQELGDLAVAIGAVNQSWETSSVIGHTAASAGSRFIDRHDYCDNDNFDPEDGAPACIDVDADPLAEGTGPTPSHIAN